MSEVKTLYKIAQSIKSLKGEATDRNVPVYILLGKGAVKELNLHNTLNFKSVLLDIDNSTLSAALPANYIDWQRVGLVVNGRILELDYDRNIFIRETGDDEYCGDLTPEGRLRNDCSCLTDGVTPDYYKKYYDWDIYSGQELHTFYTIPAYYPRKFFKISGNRIWFDSLCPTDTQVALEYKHTGLDDSGKTIIPELYVPCVEAYIKWQFALNRNDPNQDRLYMEYKRQYHLLTDVKTASTLDHIIRAMKSTKAVGGKKG